MLEAQEHPAVGRADKEQEMLEAQEHPAVLRLSREQLLPHLLRWTQKRRREGSW